MNPPANLLPDPADIQSFEHWLRGQDSRWSVIVAARTALRVLPFVVRLSNDLGHRDTLLAIVRAAAISRFAAIYPGRSIGTAAISAATATDAVAAKGTIATAAVYSAARAARAAHSPGYSAVYAAVSAVTYAASLSGSASPIHAHVANDIAELLAGTLPDTVTLNPLWPLSGGEAPDWAQEATREFYEALPHLGEHWHVWADWYFCLFSGARQGEAWDACFVDLDPDDPLPWDEGPKAVNERIAARLAKLNDDVATSRGGIERPEQPLPPPSGATKFRVLDGRIDLVPPDAWASREASAIAYHRRALSIAQDLLGRIENVEPALGATIAALMDVLGTSVADVQPDNLRMAWRSVESRARAYGHPNAAGEISVTSVSLLFELSGVLTDLQAIAAPALQAHEEAIRQLALTSAGAAEVKPVLDMVVERLADSPAVTEQVAAVLTSAREVSDAAVDPDVQVQVESGRILQTENLALAIAHELASPQANASPVTDDSKSENAADKPGSTRKRSSSGRRSARGPNGGIDLDDWAKRFRGRLDAKLPEAVADGLIKLGSSPRLSIAGLGAFLVAMTHASPVVSGALVLISAWIVFQLFQKRPPSP